MKIVAVIMKYDYGVEERGFSYEYYNVYLPLVDVYGRENVTNFDFYSLFKKWGKNEMNKKLHDFIKSEKPDITIFCLFENELDEDLVNNLREFTKTIVYFFDDPWRQNYVRHWIKFFDCFSTPDYYMFKKYKLEGLKNALYSPFGFNYSVYKKLHLEKIYDVTFVGNYSAYREWLIYRLIKEGIQVTVFGRGWKESNRWLSHEDMVKIFNQSKINLNLSNSKNKDIDFLFRAVKSPKALKQLLLLKKDKEQVKGRHYEINGCGGFQMSYFVPGLNLAYEIDKEIVVYEDINNLSEEIKYFLKDDKLRESIARNGYERSIKDHKSQNYLKNLVEQVINN